MNRIRASLAATLAVVAVMASVAVASPASATTVQSNCVTNSMCLYYNSTGYGLGAEFGSLVDVYSFNPAHSGGYTYYFKTGAHGSAGNGQNVWNNAAAGRDYMNLSYFYVFYNTGWTCTGGYDVVYSGGYTNLSVTKNEDTSMSSDPC